MKSKTVKILIFIMTSILATSSVAVMKDNYENQKDSWDQHKAIVDESDFRQVEWRNVGPVVQGGRVVAVKRSLQNFSTLYLAYASGGVWKSSDNGITFKPITDHLPNQIVGAFVIDPQDDNILWLGTGENNSSRSSYGGVGVFRSTDGGLNWQHMGLGDTNRIGDIVIDPNDSNRVWVASLGALYTKGGQRGVFMTEDGGDNWVKVLDGDKHTGFVDLSLASNGDLYAAAWERERKAWNFVEGGEGSKLYKSSDGGKNWQQLNNGLPSGNMVGRMGVEVAPSDSSVVYVVVDNQELLPESEWDMGDTAINPKRLKKMSKEEFLTLNVKDIEGFLKSNRFPPDMTAEKVIEQIKSEEMSVQDLVKSLKDANTNLFNTDIKGLEIYRSDDGGVSFKKTHNEPLSNVVFTYGYYFGIVRVDPNDKDTIYTMGVPLIKSTDGGKTWESIHAAKVHVDYHDLWINPNDSNHLISGNDGGADESYDQGKNWRKIDYQPVGQFYTVAVDMAEPYNVYGGLQDNGTLKGSSQNDWTQGESWERLFGGDGMYVSVDDEDDIVYVGFQFGNNFKIKNGKPTSIKPPNYINEKPLRFNWNSPVILSQHNNDIIYYGANKLFQSFDQGENWNAISKDLTQSLKRGDVPYATITSISESPLEFGRLVVGTDDGMVWTTDDNGKSWKNVSKKLPKKLWVSRVVASKYDKKRLWLTLNNYRNDDLKSYVYTSDNFGKSWQSVQSNMPHSAVNVIKEDPKVKGLVYVGTDRGVYFSSNFGESWSAIGDLPTVPVHDLIVHPRDNELVVATHGRSIFIADVSDVQNIESLKKEQLKLLQPEAIRFRSSWNSRPSRWYASLSPSKDSQFKVWSDSQKEVEVSVLDENENPLYKETVSLSKGLNIWNWNNRLNVEMALKAEEENNKEKEKPLNKAETPVSEGLRLGHDIYIQKGKYTLSVSYDELSSKQEFEVK